MALDVKDKKVTVVGLARSGVAAASLLSDAGSRVTVTDIKKEEELREEVAQLNGKAIRYRVGGHAPEDFLSADLIVVSPGVPLTLPLLQQAMRKGAPVISEVELASHYLGSPIVGITGTNGKSTTTVLVGDILTTKGHKVFVGGNLGQSLCEAVLQGGETRWEWIVAELSSFQLEAVKAFRPHIAAVLNVTPDHLDRYPDFAHYREAKRRIFMNQGGDDCAVLNADDEITKGFSSGLSSRVVFFSRRGPVKEGVFLEKGTIVAHWKGERREVLDAGRLKIQGSHNVENALAATAISLLCGCSPEEISKVLETFTGLEHRMEPVREVSGVLYINDSKGTNVGAVAKGLEGFTRPVILIAGGRDKGADFSPLQRAVKDRVKKLILIGEARERIRAALASHTSTVFADSLPEAVSMAAGSAREGDVVLLSPACASFDMFKDFEERGKVFKEAVWRL